MNIYLQFAFVLGLLLLILIGTHADQLFKAEAQSVRWHQQRLKWRIISRSKWRKRRGIHPRVALWKLQVKQSHSKWLLLLLCLIVSSSAGEWCKVKHRSQAVADRCCKRIVIKEVKPPKTYHPGAMRAQLPPEGRVTSGNFGGEKHCAIKHKTQQSADRCCKSKLTILHN